MQRRYDSGKSSKDRLKDPSPKRENINIQIFNITARNRKKMHSVLKNKGIFQLDDSMQISNEQGIRRGRSVFQRKPNSSQLIDPPTQPIVPSSEHIKNISSKRLKKQPETSTRSFMRETAEEDIGIEQLHYQMVEYQQYCKKLIRS